MLSALFYLNALALPSYFILCAEARTGCQCRPWSVPEDHAHVQLASRQEQRLLELLPYV